MEDITKTLLALLSVIPIQIGGDEDISRKSPVNQRFHLDPGISQTTDDLFISG
jgi:non-ribosomal peptide synthetase component F